MRAYALRCVLGDERVHTARLNHRQVHRYGVCLREMFFSPSDVVTANYQVGDMSAPDWIGVAGFVLALALAVLEIRRRGRKLKIFISDIEERSTPSHGVVLLVSFAVVNNSSTPKRLPKLRAETDKPLKINPSISHVFDPITRVVEFNLSGVANPIRIPEDLVGRTPTEIGAGSLRTFSRPFWLTTGDKSKRITEGLVRVQAQNWDGDVIASADRLWKLKK